MADSARSIVELLNQPPFNKTFTLISYVLQPKGMQSLQIIIIILNPMLPPLDPRFDSLEPLSLLQLLNDVFAEIAPEVSLITTGASEPAKNAPFAAQNQDINISPPIITEQDQSPRGGP